MTEVADAEFERLLTSTAFARLARRSLEESQYATTDTEMNSTRDTHHSQIESSIGKGCSVVVDIIEHALGNLQHTLVDDILVGPDEEQRLESRECWERQVLHSSNTHWIPNLIPLKRLGRLSTSCSLVELTNAACAILSPLQIRVRLCGVWNLRCLS